MNNEDKKEEKSGEHYVCYGGCRGVADKPGTCQAQDCISRGQELEKCNCADDKHYDFKLSA